MPLKVNGDLTGSGGMGEVDRLPVLFIGPRHSLRAMGIVEMGMSVDDH